MKKFVIFIYFFSSLLYTKDIILPIIKHYENQKICILYSSKGEITSSFLCEDIRNQTKDLISVKKNNRWGFVDQQGNWVIRNEYDFADNFYSDLARVRVKDKYGFIDKKNSIIIPIKYNYAGNFSDKVNLAPIQCNDHNYLYGYIDKQGIIKIECQYQIAYEFRNLIARARKWDLYGYIYFDPAKRILEEFKNFQYELAGDFGNSITYVFNHNGFFLIHKDGHLIHPKNSNWILGNFSISDVKSLGVFQDLQTGLYGYMNEDQQIVIPAIFLRAYEFFYDYAKVIGPSIYKDPNIPLEVAQREYRLNKYEEFYIDLYGNRVTY